MTPEHSSRVQKRPRALIVEDEILVAWQLQSTLEDLGFEADELVSNGTSALNLVQSGSFEVLFMDVNLSGPPDGAETAQRLREFSDTPIVFVTAYSHYDSIYTGLRRITRSAVVGKPATPSAITEALRELGLATPGH